MRRPLIAGNWKMNKTVKETVDFISKLKKMKFSDDRDVLICPPFTALSDAAKTVKKSEIKLGAQNMHFEENGAFTGEISPLMLKELVDYVLIGHSERRHVFGEDDKLLNKKLISALRHGLRPIFCIGEKLEERKKSKTKDVVKRQILNGLTGIKDINKIIIAYEPVWAIGTGVNATPEQAEEVHDYIRSIILNEYGEKAGSNLSILYGGSVKPENVKSLMVQEDIDGVLVGGASLDVEKFYKLINF